LTRRQSKKAEDADGCTCWKHDWDLGNSDNFRNFMLLTEQCCVEVR
jgi:hypothetical protein